MPGSTSSDGDYGNVGGASTTTTTPEPQDQTGEQLLDSSGHGDQGEQPGPPSGPVSQGNPPSLSDSGSDDSAQPEPGSVEQETASAAALAEAEGAAALAAVAAGNNAVSTGTAGLVQEPPQGSLYTINLERQVQEQAKAMAEMQAMLASMRDAMLAASTAKPPKPMA